MCKKYYLDTCIWRDYFENRSDGIRPLGDWAFLLIKKIIDEDKIIVYSDILHEELREFYSENKLTSLIPEITLIKINSDTKQIKEAIKKAKEKNIPKKDALHAVIARDTNSIMVTRDKHFELVTEEVKVRKPEELI